MTMTFPLARPSTAARTTMHVLTAVVTLICLVPALFAPRPVQVMIVLIDFVAVGALFRVVLRMDRVTFNVSGNGLDIQGDLYNRKLALSALDLAQAKRLSQSEYEAMRPTLKLNGVGAPGYLSGWFMLRGVGKAFIYVTDKNKAVFIPTTEGFGLMLTPDDPDSFLSALRAG
jgi:hypothetical protein